MTAAAPQTYLDHAASTPVRPEVVEAMLPFITVHHGNPSGAHAAARHARRAVDDARDEVAALVGCDPGEVVFTSGGTEADVTALVGAATALGPEASLVVSPIEHAAVGDTADALGRSGHRVHRPPVDERGRVDPGAVAGAAGDDGTVVVSIGLANNEVGTIHPLAGVADVLRTRRGRSVLHTDAVQAAAWLDLTVAAAPADLVAVSGHKLGGPKGVGALIVREGTPWAPVLYGGGQERGRRSGTPNVPGIVGLGVAARLLREERATLAAAVAARRDRLASALLPRLARLVPGARETVVAPGDDRRDHVLPGHLHLCLPGVSADEVLFCLDDAGLAASAASSCASGATEPSHVLAALGVDPATARGSLRLTLGRTTTDEDVERAVDVVAGAVARAAGVPGAAGHPS